MAFEDGDMSVSDSISLGGRPRCEKKLLYNGNGISISGTNYSIKKLMVMHDENTLFTILYLLGVSILPLSAIFL
jgi:hypothetical protein